MHVRRMATAVGLVLLTISIACAPVRPGGSQASDGGAQRPPVFKRVTAAILASPPILINKIEKYLQGTPEIETLVGAGLSVLDEGGTLRPVLAEAVPSIENGLWKLAPDGTMELTWKIRGNARWHDGTPFTADDLVFTARVAQAMPNFRHAAYQGIDTVEAVDSQTVVARWKRVYYQADRLFTHDVGSRYTAPLPRHLLEQAYSEGEQSLLNLPYWAEGFVGTGPFRLREWVQGSHVILQANDNYALGRPKIDELEVKFIPDSAALVANLLSGSVEMTLGKALNIEQGLEVRERAPEFEMTVSLPGWEFIAPQFINPDPAVIANLQFRRALTHALDRQQMVDTFMAGLSFAGHSILSPKESKYREINERNVVRYDHDPRRAVRLIEELGYTRGPDGIFRDGANQKLALELRGTAGDLTQKMQFATADFWKQVGVETEILVIPDQRVRDQAWRDTRPGFEISGGTNGLRAIPSLHTSQVPLPENNFFGQNDARYSHPELDGLIDRMLITIAEQERLSILGGIVRHVSDQLPIIGMVYSADPTVAAKRIQNLTGRHPDSTGSWNAHEWELR